VPTRKEEQERRRAERLAAEQQAQSANRRRLMAGYIVAGALTLAVVVGLVVALASGGDDGGGGGSDACEEAHVDVQSGFTHGFEPDCREGTPPPEIAQGDLDQAAQAANCELRENLPEEGNTHITDESQAKYKTNPPTSGDHNEEQQADGAYAEQPDPWYTVHAMEHGRIEIQYSPDLPEEDQLALKGVFDEAPGGVLLFPNPDMPYDVAATAWTQLIGCKTFEGDATLDAIRDFRDIYIGQGPENVPFMTGEA
jgi:hypothetical protein